ncbi:small secreted protein [Streptomyces sp. NBC_01340]|uniref:small secreted protein n=1 Tax=unclassified Streptomyces TaxID=2593676 RepID=UPI0022521BFA|nr:MULTISPECIES: small secreted protein [unclassified Streptomyces]MCX4455812.1 small secreted protein [Streptomyces sp. NBC_01719]MCX4495172.1 small secreted protein [Streptomyces sp. NBC_01728]MCX4590298.1 small secreted protein [Streptomyces sp. NBC_01549]WSI40141.1 small secreted protein [Streptomyces sp. NBC_01340]
MNKKLAAALSGGAVLVLALSACSSGSSTKDDKLDPWAKQVCDAVQPQVQKIAAANTAIQKETTDQSAPADVQKADSKGFQDISDAYKAMAAAIEKAGPPDVDSGKTKQENAVKELNALSASYADLGKQSDALNTKDQAKFADGLDGVAKQLEKLSKTGTDALKELEAGDVGKAMAKQVSCKSASASASPATTQG